MKRNREIKEHVLTFKVAPSLVKKIDAEADSKGVSRSAVLRWAVIKFFEADTKVAV